MLSIYDQPGNYYYKYSIYERFSMRKFLLFATKSIRGFIYGIFSVSLILFLISRGDSPLIAGLIASGSIIFKFSHYIFDYV